MQDYFVYTAGAASKGSLDQVVALIQAICSLGSIFIAAKALVLTSKNSKQQAIDTALALAQTAKNAKRQAADNLSAKRQIWIEDLQKDAATFLALLARREELRRPNPQSTEPDQKQTFDERRDVDLKAYECGIRIKLRLNPTDPDHQELEILFVALAKVCPPPQGDETPEQMKLAQAKFSESRDAIVSQFQKIFVREWEHIKDRCINRPLEKAIYTRSMVEPRHVESLLGDIREGIHLIVEFSEVWDSGLPLI